VKINKGNYKRLCHHKNDLKLLTDNHMYILSKPVV